MYDFNTLINCFQHTQFLYEKKIFSFIIFVRFQKSELKLC